MDRLDMAIALLQEAKEEKERLAQYNKEYSKLSFYGSPDYDPEENRRFWKKWSRVPKKSVINDNIKMARRLLLGERM